MKALHEGHWVCAKRQSCRMNRLSFAARSEATMAEAPESFSGAELSSGVIESLWPPALKGKRMLQQQPAACFLQTDADSEQSAWTAPRLRCFLPGLFTLMSPFGMASLRPAGRASNESREKTYGRSMEQKRFHGTAFLVRQSRNLGSSRSRPGCTGGNKQLTRRVQERWSSSVATARSFLGDELESWPHVLGVALIFHAKQTCRAGRSQLPDQSGASSFFFCCC